MDDLTRQKIPIIIKEHVLRTKIGYVIDILKLEKRKCRPINLDMEKGMEKGTSVYVKHSTYQPIKDIRKSDPTLEIRRDASGVVDRS